MKASARYVQSMDVTTDSSRQFWNFKGPVVPQNDTVHTAYGVMDVVTGFGHDALDDFTLQSYPGNISKPWQITFYTQPTCGNVNELCTPDQDSSPPTFKTGEKELPELESLHRILDIDKLPQVVSPPWDFPSNATVKNLFTALLFAARLDIGRLTSNNYFLNVDAINATVLDGGRTPISFRGQHTGRHGIGTFPISGYPAVILLSYTCHGYFRKSTGSFLVNLYIGA